MRVVQAVLVAAAALALAGCPKKVDVQPDTVPTTSTQGGASTAPVTPRTDPAASELAAEQAAMAELDSLGRVIYFDYDKAEIKSEFVPVIAAHARFLSAKPSRKVRIEGHTDERGSREYNIGLGERRAQAVRRALMLQGVGEDQIVTISYGEERPAASGSDEDAYAKNRRAELSNPR